MLGAVDRRLAERTAVLVEDQERGGEHAQQLADADSLSFFSLNSAGFLACYGAEHTAEKVRGVLARMSHEARERLDRVRLPQVIRDQLG